MSPKSLIIIDPPNDKHRQEWLDSAVSELIIDANLHTITDHRTINHFLGWKTPKGAAGKQTKEDRTCWAVWGINPLDPQSGLCGLQIKPDNPRLNEDKKPVKYESPVGKGEARQPLFLAVPDPIWEQIATKWAVPVLPEDYQNGFWQWVINKTQIPVLITEGAKKAGALLSAGYACISIAGVSNGQYLGELNPYIAPFATVGRKVVLAYDSDLHYKETVRKELDRLGRLLAAAGTTPYVMQWAQETKGIDDYIGEFGTDELDKIYSIALTFEKYRKAAKDEADSIEEEKIEDELHFNQIAIATIYKDQRYICLSNVLHRWTGTHYEASPDAVEKRRIFRFCNSYTVYDPKYKKNFYKHANSTSVNSVLEWMKASCSVTIDDINPAGLNLLNGILTIAWNGRKPLYTLKKHDPSIFYTYVSNINYDPKADPTYCDKLLSVLEPAQQDIFLKVIASTLDTAGVRARVPSRSIRCLMMKGTGHNGKDTLRELVREIMGGIFMTSCSLTDFKSFDTGDKFALAPLLQSKINWSPENTDSLNLDKMQTMKSAISGDSINIRDLYEKSKEIIPEFALIFNVNKMPSITGAQEAIKSRYAILSFDKTFVENPDPNNPNQLKGDQRYKYDPTFKREKVAPALLNRLLLALTDLMANGIDYSSCDAAIQTAREDSCHLLKWTKEIGLEYGNGQVRLGDLFNHLKRWYVDNGILDLEESSTGKEKFVWLDEGDRYDPFVKASNRIKPALANLFPDATFSERTRDGFFIIGVQSLRFAILPNLYSSGSQEKRKVEETSISAREPNCEPKKIDSQNDFDSQDKSVNQNQICEPNFSACEPRKPDNHAICEPREPREPNLGATNFSHQELPLKIGDRVRIKSPHFLAGKTGVISSLVEIVDGDRPTTFEAIISNPNFAVSPSIPIDKLERVA
jgi:putative DNA primase/helicase